MRVFGVETDGELDPRTLSGTKQAAMVNYLFLAGAYPKNEWSYERITIEFLARKGDLVEYRLVDGESVLP